MDFPVNENHKLLLDSQAALKGMETDSIHMDMFNGATIVEGPHISKYTFLLAGAGLKWRMVSNEDGQPILRVYGWA